MHTSSPGVRIRKGEFRDQVWIGVELPERERTLPVVLGEEEWLDPFGGKSQTPVYPAGDLIGPPQNQ